MVMLPFPLDLIMMMLLGEVPLLHQPQLLKQAEGAIDRGETEAWFPLLGQAIELIGIKVTFRAA